MPPCRSSAGRARPCRRRPGARPSPSRSRTSPRRRTRQGPPPRSAGPGPGRGDGRAAGVPRSPGHPRRPPESARRTQPAPAPGPFLGQPAPAVSGQGLLLNGFRQDTLRLTEREAFSYGRRRVLAMMITPDRLTSLFRPQERRPGRRVGQVDVLADRLQEPRRVRLRRPHLPGQPARRRHPRPADRDLLRADRRAGRRGVPDGAPGRDARRARRRRRGGDPQRGRALVRLRRGGGGGPGRGGRARRPRRVARHGAARPQPPGLRQPHRGRAGLLDPRPAARARPGGAAVAERRELGGHDRLRGDGWRRAVLPGHPRQRGDDHRRARARLPRRRPGHPGGGDLHGDRARPGRLPPRRAAGGRGGQGHRGAQGRAAARCPPAPRPRTPARSSATTRSSTRSSPTSA